MTKEEILFELYMEKYITKTQYHETLKRIRKEKEKVES